MTEYAGCAEMRVTGWDYPALVSPRSMVEESGLLPLTCPQSLTPEDKTRLLEGGYVFCRELTERDIAFIPRDHLEKVRSEALQACKGKAPGSTR